MNRTQAKQYNVTSLAYIGDAVYELKIRELVLTGALGSEDAEVDTSAFRISKPGPIKNAGLAHKEAVRFVSSNGQALAARAMCEQGFLTEEEERILKRGRNHRATSRPANADPRKYKWATGFESLIGFLHLVCDYERIDEIVREAIRIIASAPKK